MIYAILKFFTRYTLFGYFRKYKVDGRENIPKKGPYIFVANHPSAFMDPLVVASTVKTPVYFIAAGEYVGKGIKGWIFRNILHMIPVFRPSTRPEDAHKNKDMFIKCYEHLGKGNSLLIFPEGVSITEKKLKEIKTGTIRIALGAEKAHDYNLKLAIIPIGLNYSSPHEWRSDLYVKIGKPIYINDFGSFDPDGEIEHVRKITKHLQGELEKLVIHTETEEEEEMLNKLDQIYSNDIKQEFKIQFNASNEEFDVQKDFAAAISYFKKSQFELYTKTEKRLDNYLKKLNNFNLTDKNIAQYKEQLSFRRIFSFILGAPFFLVGYLSNILPYKLVVFIHSKLKLDKTFSGSIALALGLFLFLFWYSGITTFIWFKTDLNWWTLFAPVIMYITGMYALIYLAAMENSIQRNILRSFHSKNKKEAENLLKERKEIINILTACKEDYLKSLKES